LDGLKFLHRVVQLAPPPPPIVVPKKLRTRKGLALSWRVKCLCI